MTKKKSEYGEAVKILRNAFIVIIVIVLGMWFMVDAGSKSEEKEQAKEKIQRSVLKTTQLATLKAAEFDYEAIIFKEYMAEEPPRPNIDEFTRHANYLVVVESHGYSARHYRLPTEWSYSVRDNWIVFGPKMDTDTIRLAHRDVFAVHNEAATLRRILKMVKEEDSHVK